MQDSGREVLHRRVCKFFDATPTFVTLPTDKCEQLAAQLEYSYVDSVCQSDQEATKSCS